jgi:glutathione S-transferase
MIKIYGRANSLNVRKVLWVLGEIGESFTRDDWGRGYRPTTEPEFMKVSQFGVVPVIDDDGFILRESNAIVRYLAAKHGRADLYPTDLKARAIVDQWMDYGTTDLGSGMRPVFQGKANNLAPWNDPKIIAWGEADWIKQFSRVEAHLAEAGPYMAGKSFTIGDIPVGVMTNRWFALEFSKPELPKLAAYYDRLSERAPYMNHVRNGIP